MAYKNPTQNVPVSNLEIQLIPKLYINPYIYQYSYFARLDPDVFLVLNMRS